MVTIPGMVTILPNMLIDLIFVSKGLCGWVGGGAYVNTDQYFTFFGVIRYTRQVVLSFLD